MSVFLVGFATLVALALLILLPTLMSRRSLAQWPPGAASDDASGANLLVLREQNAALEAEYAAGALDAEQYRQARVEIERRALEEDQAVATPVQRSRSGKTAIGLAVLLPLFAFVVYALLGNPQALLPRSEMAAANPGSEITSAQVEEMVNNLAKRLESKPGTDPADLQAWTMLARSFGALQRFPEASRAYARARGIAPDDPQLLADHADVMAMMQGQTLAGEPLKLIERALQLDPKNFKALALAGSAAFERKDFAGALNYWNQAVQLAPPGSEFASGLQSSIQQARVAAGGGATAANAGQAVAALGPSSAAGTNASSDANASDSVSAASGGQTSGVVQLAGALAAKVAPTDTVFVFARAVQGPRMPLAILKRKASDLPLRFTLDDSNAMSPELKLSRFPKVVIGARISRSGDAMPQSGDLMGQIGPVSPGTGKLVLVIDSVQP